MSFTLEQQAVCRDKYPILYKYSDYCGADHIINNGTLKFTRPENLNDPFELLVEHVYDENDPEQKAFFKRKVRECYPKARDRITKRKQIEKNVLNFLNKPKLYSDYGVLSLTTDPAERLMWTHYAAGGKGVCIGFSHERLFNWIACDENIHLNLPLHVRYENKAIPVPLFSPPNDNHIAPLLTKHVDFSYEEEIRILRTYQSTKQSEVIDFDRGCICQVVFGLGLTNKQKRNLEEAISKFPTVEIFEIGLNKFTYSYELKKL